MTILAHKDFAHLTRLMALLPVLCEDREERGGGLVQKENMDNCFCPDRGKLATTGQNPAKNFIPFLNKIEQAEITQGIDNEWKTAEWQRQN